MENLGGTINKTEVQLTPAQSRKDHRSLLMSLAMDNPLCIKSKIKKEDYLVFSLDECSDIEPISEEEEEEPNTPECTVTVLPFDAVPRLSTSKRSYPCFVYDPVSSSSKGDEWSLPPVTKKYAREMAFQEWTDWLAKNPRAKIKNKKKIKEELESSTIQIFTETIKDAVANDGKRTPRRNTKKGTPSSTPASTSVQLIPKTKENNQRGDGSNVNGKDEELNNNHYDDNGCHGDK